MLLFFSIAGQPRETSFHDGIGREAHFSYVIDFYQVDANIVILVDQANHCIRHVQRSSRNVTTYLGWCRNNGMIAIGVKLPPSSSDVRFYVPTTILYNEQSRTYYILNYMTSSITAYSLEENLLWTLVADKVNIVNPFSFVFTKDERGFMVNHQYGFSRVDIASKEIELVAGQRKKDKTSPTPIDGELLEAAFLRK